MDELLELYDFAPVTVGTVGGDHTLGEIQDLVRAKDYEHTQIQQSAQDHADLVNARDVMWATDWLALLERYDAAKARAQAAIGEAGSADLSKIAREDLWQDILHTLTATTGHYGPKDEQGLYNRLILIGVKPDVSNVPQPSSPDSDLGIYRAASDLQKAADDAAADLAKKATTAADDVIHQPAAWAAFAALGLLAIIALRR